MNTHIKPQIIISEGKPAFAVIPWDEYQSLMKNSTEEFKSDILFPNEVVKANTRGDCLIKAWREYLGFTQKELADKAEMKQSAIARIESSDTLPRKSTLKKLAEVMGIEVEQLIE